MTAPHDLDPGHTMIMEAVVKLVQSVGCSLQSWKASGGAEGTWEGSQFHAKADQWAHQLIGEGLSNLKTELPVVSEEDLLPATTTDVTRYWLVDPIDGTASYAEGFAGYVTQVALMEREHPVLAVVFAPHYQELFSAVKGGGAYRNGIRLPLESSSSLTLIDNYPSPRGVAEDLYNEMSFRRYTECGSIGLKICRVAEGAADVFFKPGQVRDWDLAAPHLILQEAGGHLLDATGNEISYGASRRHQGLVAAREDELVHHVASWYHDRILGNQTVIKGRC
ncbi:MAG TPA: inositol monophosphatase family protein [Vicinamibacterales bacterium]|nr:inositol monophosphatase family protein [Vicinamibacterales bacterium]